MLQNHDQNINISALLNNLLYLCENFKLQYPSNKITKFGGFYLMVRE